MGVVVLAIAKPQETLAEFSRRQQFQLRAISPRVLRSYRCCLLLNTIAAKRINTKSNFEVRSLNSGFNCWPDDRAFHRQKRSSLDDI